MNENFSLTLIEARSLTVKAAEALGIEQFSTLCLALGVSPKTQQRWYKGFNDNPSGVSSMKFINYVQLKAIIGEPVIEPVSQEVNIPKKYIMTAKNYQCPPLDFLKSLIGINSDLKMSRVDIASALSINRKWFSQIVADEQLTFLVYSGMLLLAGVKPETMFKKINNEFRV